MDKKIAVITGANRGIGFEIAKQLAGAGIKIILTARDEKKGKEAVNLLADGGDVIFRRLDVIDEKSIKEFASYMEKEWGYMDILINNAGILIDKDRLAINVEPEKLRLTLETNLIAPLYLSQLLIPLMMKKNWGRIVNISSGMGAFAGEYTLGMGVPSYRISKTALNAFTRILADELKDTGIIVNSMCPGWVRTDMGGKDAYKSVEEGADTAFYLATLPDDGPRGQFFRDRKVIPW